MTIVMRKMTRFPTTLRTCPWAGTASPSLTGYTSCMALIFTLTVRYVVISSTEALKLSKGTSLSGVMPMACDV